MSKGKIILNGLIKENPIFVLFLGMCPVLATSGSVYSAIGMSVCVFLVLLLSNIIISLVSKITPDEIRIPVYIIIIATIVSTISMLVEAFAPGIYSTLGAYLQLIVVNCIILGRAESFASKNNVVDSIMDAIGIAGGFLIAMLCVSLIREVVGTGQLVMKDLNGKEIFQLRIIPLDEAQNLALTDKIATIMEDKSLTEADMAYKVLKAKCDVNSSYAISLFNQPAGAFLVLGVCVAAFVAISDAVASKKAAKAKAATKKA